MKKIVLLVCVLLCFCSSTFAVTHTDWNNKDRWYWALSNSECTMYVDKINLKYDVANDTATFYTLEVYPADKMRQITNVKIDFTKNTYQELSARTFKSDGTVKYWKTEKPYDIYPGTGAEQIAYVVSGLIGRDKKHVEYEDMKNNPGHIAY